MVWVMMMMMMMMMVVVVVVVVVVVWQSCDGDVDGHGDGYDDVYVSSNIANDAALDKKLDCSGVSVVLVLADFAMMAWSEHPGIVIMNCRQQACSLSIG